MTRLQELLDIELPIIQAPMAGVQGSALAVAVSNAGGLGSLPCAMLDPDAIVNEISSIRLQSSKPFNLNFFSHNSPQPDPNRDLSWQEMLSPYYREFDIDQQTINPGVGRIPFNEQALEIVRNLKPAVVSFHFGLPDLRLLEIVKQSGAKVLATATTVAEGLWLEQRGVDAIIAQGLEAGGHRGNFLSNDIDQQMGTFSLVPQIVAAVKLPVVAAGGIASVQGVEAALQLGADGVQIGTSYLLCPEANTSATHRAALKSNQAHHTAVTNVFTGRPARSIVNRLIQEIGPISPYTPEFPLAATDINPLRSKAESLGRGDFSPLWCGQNAAGCREISAAELTHQFCNF